MAKNSKIQSIQIESFPEREKIVIHFHRRYKNQTIGGKYKSHNYVVKSLCANNFNFSQRLVNKASYVVNHVYSYENWILSYYYDRGIYHKSIKKIFDSAYYIFIAVWFLYIVSQYLIKYGIIK